MRRGGMGLRWVPTFVSIDETTGADSAEERSDRRPHVERGGDAARDQHGRDGGDGQAGDGEVGGGRVDDDGADERGGEADVVTEASSSPMAQTGQGQRPMRPTAQPRSDPRLDRRRERRRSDLDLESPGLQPSLGAEGTPRTLSAISSSSHT